FKIYLQRSHHNVTSGLLSVNASRPSCIHSRVIQRTGVPESASLEEKNTIRYHQMDSVERFKESISNAPGPVKWGAAGALVGAAAAAVVGPLGAVAGAVTGAQAAATIAAVLDPPLTTRLHGAADYSTVEAPVIGPETKLEANLGSGMGRGAGAGAGAGLESGIDPEPDGANDAELHMQQPAAGTRFGGGPASASDVTTEAATGMGNEGYLANSASRAAGAEGGEEEM
ncbi:hypothetical protein Vafri_19267, partial [Volvox africanus]